MSSSFFPLIEASKAKTTDRFGITYLYPTAGRVFESHWDQGGPRSLQAFQRDPIDSDLIVRGKNALVEIDGNGTALMRGLIQKEDSSPRIYVYDKQKLDTWHNTEMTGCMMRISEKTHVSTAGLVMISRSEHQDVDLDPANGRGYGGRLAYDGRIDFVKEVVHGKIYAFSDMKYYPWNTKDEKFPFNQWICAKFVTYNLPNENVMLELYLDLTGGLKGGNWKKINQFIDDGSWQGLAFTDPATSVYLRNDGLGEDIWKNFSVREIIPPECHIPSNGNWSIKQNCFFSTGGIIPASMKIQNKSLIIIPDGTSLLITAGHNLTVEDGSKVLINNGGALVVVL